MKLSMESIVNGISSSSETQSSASVTGSSSSSSNSSSTSETPRPSGPPSPKPSRSEEPCTSESIIRSNGVKVIRYPNGSISYQKQSFKPANEITLYEEVPTMAERYDESKIGKTEKGLPFNSGLELLTTEARSCIRNPLDGIENSHLTASLGPETRTPGPGTGSSGQLNSHKMDQSELSLAPISSSSQSAGTQYSESKAIVPTTEAIKRTGSTEKSGISSEVTDSFGFTDSRKVNTYRGSTSSDVSDESSLNSFSSASYKPHKANDTRWEAIQAVRSKVRELELKHFRLLKRLGCGDIGSVYLSELCGTKSSFAIKVMDKAALASRKKLLRAQTEREILQCLDHPFLPTLYTHFETDKLTCLVMEFCPGGDLHALRQKQPVKLFPEHAARFYVAEVLLALEYLHMLGIIYRDLKPENVLVREDGHIMLSDFDLSLRCSVSPTLVRSSNPSLVSKNSYFAQPARMGTTCVMQPDCMQPACFGPRFFSSKPKKDKKKKKKSKDKVNNETTHQVSLPELLAEPTNARSMSFVGTHEYLAPEIIKGEGHGSAVDWWTFGIFLYELLFGKTPFKGAGNRATLFNVVGEPLKFPDYPTVSFAARDLIRGLLVKEPQHRLAYKRGATEIKQHPFFQSVNWALIRCTSPPEVPRPDIHAGMDVKASGNYLEVDFF